MGKTLFFPFPHAAWDSYQPWRCLASLLFIAFWEYLCFTIWHCMLIQRCSGDKPAISYIHLKIYLTYGNTPMPVLSNYGNVHYGIGCVKWHADSISHMR